MFNLNIPMGTRWQVPAQGDICTAYILLELACTSEKDAVIYHLSLLRGVWLAFSTCESEGPWPDRNTALAINPCFPDLQQNLSF